MNEERIAEIFSRYGFTAILEPFTGPQPDILAFDKSRRKVIVVEVKWEAPVNTRGVYQACSYASKLRPLFGALGFETEVWIIAKGCTSYQEEKLRKCGVKYVNQEELEERLKKI